MVGCESRSVSCVCCNERLARAGALLRGVMWRGCSGKKAITTKIAHSRLEGVFSLTYDWPCADKQIFYDVQGS